MRRLVSAFRRDLDDLPELWRATVPGVDGHVVAVCSETESVYVSDGWQVPYPSSSLFRLHVRTGEQLAARRTRHQGVGAVTVASGSVWAATDSRLFELDRLSLEVHREWDSRLVRYTKQLVPSAGRIVMANWLAPTVGIFDPESGSTRRVRTSGQPVVFREGDAVMVGSGLEGGLATLDVHRAKLSARTDAPAMTAIASTEAGAWAVLGGRKVGGQGDPPAWSRRPSERLQRLSDGTICRLSSSCGLIAGASNSWELWCATGDRDRLELVNAHTGTPVAGFRVPGPVVHVDPRARLALSIIRPPASSRSTEEVPTSEMAAVALPSLS